MIWLDFVLVGIIGTAGGWALCEMWHALTDKVDE